MSEAGMAEIRRDVRELRGEVRELSEDVHARPTRAELYTFILAAVAVGSLITGLLLRVVA